MAVVFVGEDFGGSSERSIDGFRDERTFHVVTDSPADGPIVARQGSASPYGAVPQYGDAHPSLTGSYVQRIRSASIGGDPCHFQVSVSYGNKAPGQTNPPGDDYPWVQPAVCRPTEDRATEEVTVDVDGLYVVNSAGDLFSPALTREVTLDGIEIEQYERDFDFGAITFYKNKVNSKVWMGLAPGTVRLCSVLATLVEAEPSNYWKMVYVLKIKAEGWNPRVVDLGFKALQFNLAGDKESLDVIMDTNNVPVTTPEFLDGTGRMRYARDKRTESSPGLTSEGLPWPLEGIAWPPILPDNPEGTFKLYDKVDFSLLGWRLPW
jgi:hypothetical protein